MAVPAIACIIALSASLLMLVVVVVLRPTWLVRHLLAPLLPGVIFCGDAAIALWRWIGCSAREPSAALGRLVARGACGALALPNSQQPQANSQG